MDLDSYRARASQPANLIVELLINNSKPIREKLRTIVPEIDCFFRKSLKYFGTCGI